VFWPDEIYLDQVSKNKKKVIEGTEFGDVMFEADYLMK